MSVAREMAARLVDDLDGGTAVESVAFSLDGVSFEIESAFETDDAVIVQAVRRGTITGSWRSMESPGRSVSFPLCTICKFNADNKIVYEEAYYDMQAISRQLGYHPAAAR